MWTPTHAQVTVHRARNLVPKGKGGTNDAYVTMQLGKEKYQTSVKERTENPEWHEECDMPIGSAKEVHLNVFHRSFLGLDEFLGHVSLPLDQFQIYERPRSRWYALKGRPGKKNDTKYRGEIECKVTFVVQSKPKSGSDGTESLRRAGSIKNLANTVSEKLKLPARSSSFKEKEESSKKKKAFIEPLVRSPSDRFSLPLSTGGFEFSDPAKSPQDTGPPPFAPTEEELASQASEEKTHFQEMSVDPPAKPPRRQQTRSPRSSPRDLQPRVRPRESLTSKLDHKDETPEAFSTISLPPIRPRKNVGERTATVQPISQYVDSDSTEASPATERKIGTIKECPDAESDPRMVPLQKQNKQLSFSEADLNKRWRISDVTKKVNADETDGLIRYKQPMHKSSIPDQGSQPGVESVETPAGDREAPLLKRTSSDAEAKFVQRGAPDSAVDELKPLKDTRELTKSLSKLDEEMEVSGELQNHAPNGLADRSRSSVGSSIPESIPEESTTTQDDLSSSGHSTDVQFRHTNNNTINEKDGSRRNTIQVGADNVNVATHDLKHVSECHRKSVSLSPELLEEYRGITREELIKLVHTQKNALYTKDMYIRDLENYIDNLLVRVMENTPRILQNPYSTPVTLVMTPSSQNVIKTAPAKRRSSNPFKLRK